MARIELKRGGIRALLTAPGVRADLMSRGASVAAAAEASAPVASGAYRASIHVVPDTTDRAVARVVADVPYALVVESRTGNLARALNAAGG